LKPLDLDGAYGIYAQNELDGLRIITTEKSYFVRRIPTAMDQSYTEVSNTSHALISAFKLLLKGSAEAE